MHGHMNVKLLTDLINYLLTYLLHGADRILLEKLNYSQPIFIVEPCILNSELVTHQQMHYLLNFV
jgi:hypothetical protein